jgi:hypothetical protein
VNAPSVQTVASTPNATTRVLCITDSPLDWAHGLGTLGAFFAKSVQKTEGKRDKATASLTAAFVDFNRKIA